MSEPVGEFLWVKYCVSSITRMRQCACTVRIEILQITLKIPENFIKRNSRDGIYKKKGRQDRDVYEAWFTRM